MARPRTKKRSAPQAFACPYPRCNMKSTTQGGVKMHIEKKHAVPEDLRPKTPPQQGDPRMSTPAPHVPQDSPLQTPLAFNSLPESAPQTPAPHPPTSSPANPSTPHSNQRSTTPLGSPRRPYPGVHVNSAGVNIQKHRWIDGTPCNADGFEIEENARPATPPPQDPTDFFPFESRADFELSEWIYSETQISAGKIDRLMHILTAMYSDQPPPAANHTEIYEKIDSVEVGDTLWSSFTVHYNGPKTTAANGKPPVWMEQGYEVWFRDPLEQLESMIGNPEFNGEIDYGPKIVTKDGKRRYKNVMSGKWAWEQANILVQDKDCHGAMFTPVILGSDKTTVSIATGQTDFYPLYTSLRNVHNSVRRAHRNAVAVVGFLAIPKAAREYSNDAQFRKFSNGHYCKVIYGLGPYIANYPEQALLACVIQGWCPKCTSLPDKLDDPGEADAHMSMQIRSLMDIHELLTPDLLHQVIKGNPKAAEEVLADIDRRIACAPAFPGLRHFYEGRGFKQWTGNDSKGLMKVYLPAIAGHLPEQIVRAIANLIEFCYLVRRDIIDEDTLKDIDTALADFHENREAFRCVRPEGFSLPRQHSLTHYRRSIELFGAPNGLCSSITENKHIKAVKMPYRHSNRNKPLGQMLITNQCMDKLAAARVDFTARRMLRGSGLPLHLLGDKPVAPVVLVMPQPSPLPDDDERMDFGAVEEPLSQSEVKLAKTAVRKVPIDIYQFARHVRQGRLPELTRRYLYDVLNPNAAIPGSQAPLDRLPFVDGPLRLYNSARAVYYAPSDLSGVGGMHHERIRAVRTWYGGPARYDCIFVGNMDSDEPGFRGLNVARVRVFFSVQHERKVYPCALVHWFSHVGNAPDPVTGLWKWMPFFGQPI
ncbi:hypothetical protein CPB84DRAFT_1850916 [Gymnopilus junonius]|uniref:C2H2-type domain-containing protein n=1 Tax=Gymnopilus junonius TaxID=109634 RepID=A0A9P5TJG9_GYMJU|nr:hypothetical protein CPB84DRAFT_1850916 [Gymnopilus junonius]